MDPSGAPNTTGGPDWATVYATDMQLLAQLGAGWDHDLIVLVCSIAFYGLYFGMVALSCYTIITRPQKSLSTYALLGALLLSFICVTIDTSIQAIFSFSQLRIILVQNPTISVMERYALFRQASWFRGLYITDTIVQGGGDAGLVFMVNDALAVWRALAIAHPPPYVAPVLYFFIFVTFALWIPAKVLLSTNGLSRNSIPNSDPMAILQITGSALSITVNVVATAFIAHMAYRHIMMTRETPHLKFVAGKVLLFLTESGVLYAVVQVIRLGLNLSITPETSVESRLYVANGLFSAAGYVFSAMYAPAVILIVTYRCSIADTVQLGTLDFGNDSSNPSDSSKQRRNDQRAKTLSRLQFASAFGGATTRGSEELDSATANLGSEFDDRSRGDPEKGIVEAGSEGSIEEMQLDRGDGVGR